MDSDIDFKTPIEFNIELIDNREYRYRLLKLIFKKKYYLSPKFFKFDIDARTIFCPEFNFGIQLNFNFLTLDVRYLLFIMSIMQLKVLEILTPKEAEKAILIISESLGLKVEYTAKRRTAFFKRWINNKVHEEWIMVLTSEEFSLEVESMLARSRIEFNERGFSKKGPDTG
jgi:hypothetical protein